MKARIRAHMQHKNCGSFLFSSLCNYRQNFVNASTLLKRFALNISTKNLPLYELTKSLIALLCAECVVSFAHMRKRHAEIYIKQKIKKVLVQSNEEHKNI